MHSKQEDCVICEICSKTIKAKHFLQCHVREVHSNQLYSCEFCGKTFGSKWYLKRHAELHTFVVAYACKLCGKPFDNPSLLKRHMGVQIGCPAGPGVLREE